MVAKPTLSREYIRVSLTDINFVPADLNLHRVAFTAAGIEPAEIDWIDATIDGSDVLVLVGPDRGDVVTSEDLAEGDHQMWVEVSTAASDERVVRVAGIVTVSATGE